MKFKKSDPERKDKHSSVLSGDITHLRSKGATVSRAYLPAPNRDPFADLEVLSFLVYRSGCSDRTKLSFLLSNTLAVWVSVLSASSAISSNIPSQ